MRYDWTKAKEVGAQFGFGWDDATAEVVDGECAALELTQAQVDGGAAIFARLLAAFTSGQPYQAQA